MYGQSPGRLVDPMAEESSDTDEVRPTVGTVFVGIFLDRISNGFRVVCSYIARIRGYQQYLFCSQISNNDMVNGMGLFSIDVTLSVRFSEGSWNCQARFSP